MRTVLRILESYPFQLMTAAFLFGKHLKRRNNLLNFRVKGKNISEILFYLELLVLSTPMLLVYDTGMQKGVSTGIMLLDRAILLLPVLYTVLVIWIYYDCKTVDALYYTVIAAAAQNLVFNLYWIILIWFDFHEGTIQSVLVALPVMSVIYSIVYRIFSGILREWMGYSFIHLRFHSTATVILLFIIFLNLRIVDAEHQYVVYGAYVLGDIFCLVLLFSLFFESGLQQKYQIMEQLLYAEQQKQQMTRENIELINRKCHDLKHQISALRRMNESPERDAYIQEIEKAAVFYESSAKTGNKMLDLLLMDKLLYCEKYKIKLSCIAAGEKLSFMNPMDLYSLFGNALDNAIESVINEEDEKKRIISFKVVSRGQILSIHFENYIGHELKFEDGLPITTKANKEYHGFGVMSIRHIVEKYGGTLQISSSNHLFQINILIPIPPEA